MKCIFLLIQLLSLKGILENAILLLHFSYFSILLYSRGLSFYLFRSLLFNFFFFVEVSGAFFYKF